MGSFEKRVRAVISGSDAASRLELATDVDIRIAGTSVKVHQHNVLVLFELPTKPEMGRDQNTPERVQHLALKVKDRATLLQLKAHLEERGVKFLGVTDHTLFRSIYFFDPNGHRIELAFDEPNAEALNAKASNVR